MLAIAFLFVRVLRDCFKSRRRIEGGNPGAAASTQHPAAAYTSSVIFDLGGGGRPSTAAEVRDLIREMSVANPLWGAPALFFSSGGHDEWYISVRGETT